MTLGMSRRLTLDDIADLRAYEREREEFRTRIIELKQRRRVSVGPIVTLVFENRDTIRFQVQEMARVERIISDEGIRAELDVYNGLVPEPGQLCATMFIELTSKEALMEWLPKLVGIERAVELRVGLAAQASAVGAKVDEQHDERLVRDDTTAAVHYLRFELDQALIERFGREPVTLAIVHEHYTHATRLAPESVDELLADLRP